MAARKRGAGAIVDRIEHPRTKRTGTVRLDKRSMFFSATVDDDEAIPAFESKDGAEVRSWLNKQLSVTTEAGRLKWRPVIEIEFSPDGKDSYGRAMYRDSDREWAVGLAVSVKRYYLALTHDEREWLKLRWEQVDESSPTAIPENERRAQASKYDIGPKSVAVNHYTKPFSLPSLKQKHTGAVSVVPFTPELWAGLEAAVEQITEAKKALTRMLSTKEGMKTLATEGMKRIQLALTAGGET